MDMTAEVETDFKSKFYNLQGIHINERKKNLNKLLKATSLHISSDQLDIQPRNFLEQIFYVDILIHFKKVDELIKILKEGDQILTSKILKLKWFFQEAFQNMSEEDIVNKFLPCLNYPLKMKVLKKLSLSLSEERMDKIFDYVLDKYGLFIAKQFLFSCSAEKFTQVIKNNEIILSSEQLKRIAQKDLNLLKLYFDDFKNNTGRDFNDKDFLNYLVWKHPRLWFEWEINKSVSRKLGRNTTKALLVSNKSDVLDNIEHFCRKVNNRQIIKQVKEFDKVYFPKFFPAEMDRFTMMQAQTNINHYLCGYPIKKRWEILSGTFKELYNQEITDYLNVFNDSFFQFYPKDIKRKWAKIKFQDSNYIRCLRYYNAKEGFELIKEKINLTSEVYSRRDYLLELMALCHENKDSAILEDVLKYICTRHRNEESFVMRNLLTKILHYEDELITRISWEYINELIDIQRARNEYLPFDLMLKYLIFLYNNKLPMESSIMLYVKGCIDSKRTFNLEGDKHLEAKFGILKQIVATLERVEVKNKKEIYNQILDDINTFNKKNPDYRINLNEFPYLVNYLKEFFVRSEFKDAEDVSVITSLLIYHGYSSDTPLKICEDSEILNLNKTMDKNTIPVSEIENIILKNPKRNNFEEQLLVYYFTECFRGTNYTYGKQKVAQHFLRNEPAVIEKYFNEILDSDAKYDYLDHYLIKRYSHLKLDKSLIDYFLPLASLTSTFANKATTFRALSKVMATEEFLKFIQDYLPSTKKLDLNNANEKDLYFIRCEIFKSFKNLNEPLKVAPVLVNFCEGDYLQVNLPILYKTLYHLNEEDGYSYINILKGKAVSVRKHAAFLALDLLPVKEAINLYSIISTKEQNISVSKYIFRAILKYFLKNPLEPLLDTILFKINSINKNDTELIEILVNSTMKVPNTCKAIYFEKVWLFIEILKHQKIKVSDYQYNLLNAINKLQTSLFSKLKDKFCQDIIKTYFLTDDYSSQNHNLTDFIIKYLNTHQDDSHFEFVFNIIKEYKVKHWNNKNTQYIKNIFSFFNSVLASLDYGESKFLNLFKSSWERVFNHIESFSEYFLLQLLVIYTENQTIDTFSREANKVCYDLVQSYGLCIINFLTRSIEIFFNILIVNGDKDFTKENFALCLLKNDTSVANCYIASYFVTKVTSPIFDILSQIDDPCVKIRCNYLLREIN